MEIVREDGSGVAVDWFSGQSYTHEGDGSRYCQTYVSAARSVETKGVSSSVAASDRGYCDGIAGSGRARVWVRLERHTRQGGKVVAPECAPLDMGKIVEVECPETIS